MIRKIKTKVEKLMEGNLIVPACGFYLWLVFDISTTGPTIHTAGADTIPSFALKNPSSAVGLVVVKMVTLLYLIVVGVETYDYIEDVGHKKALFVTVSLSVVLTAIVSTANAYILLTQL